MPLYSAKKDQQNKCFAAAACRRYIQDEVSSVDERRQAISAALAVLAILVLLPMAPEAADVVAVGTPANFL